MRLYVCVLYDDNDDGDGDGDMEGGEVDAVGFVCVLQPCSKRKSLGLMKYLSSTGQPSACSVRCVPGWRPWGWSAGTTVTSPSTTAHREEASAWR